MFKKKNIYVISITIIISFLVISATFLGLMVYLQWRQLNLVSNYYETLEKLDTISYVKNVNVDSLNFKLGFQKLPLLEGLIINNGPRTIASIDIRVNFLDNVGNPVYSRVIHPLDYFRSPRFVKKKQFADLVFLKEGAIGPMQKSRFTYILWRCPKKFLDRLNKKSFSNTRGEWSGKISAEIIQVKLKAI